MTTIGKIVRWNSIFRKDTGKCVCVAIDHGGIAGPMEGLSDPEGLIRACVEGCADCVLTTRGFARSAAGAWDRGTSLIMRLTGGFTVLGGKFEEALITTVRTALSWGASGAAVTVKFGHEREGDFIRNASLVADECESLGLPLMIESLAQGKDLKPDDPKATALAARAAMEIGADFVKTKYTGNPDSFRKVVEGCRVPVLILGGASEEAGDILSDVHGAMQAGAGGVAVGRAVWQHKNVKAMVEAMVGLVHEGWTAAQAKNHVR